MGGTPVVKGDADAAKAAAVAGLIRGRQSPVLLIAPRPDRAEALADPAAFIDEHSPQEVGAAFGLQPSRFKITDPKRIEAAAVKLTVDLTRQRLVVVSSGTNKEFKISYVLDYDNPVLKSQFFSATITAEVFEEAIAPARTFCLESEAEELRKHGLGKGANFDNTLVVGNNGVIKNTVRFPDEFARHKVLDFIGDLYLLGMPIRGHVFAVKSGHTLNIQLLKKIQEQRQRHQKKIAAAGPGPAVRPSPGGDLWPSGGDRKEIDIDGIMRILPHRYPFLLVDRVTGIERGKRGVGVKNVTINDNFFQGHFPARPVMPGVLMVEAMAQTAGVVILTSEAHRGKVAFFLAVDKVKFRRVVVPGDQLVMEIEVIRDRPKTAQARAVAKVGEEVAAEAEMVFSFTDASYLD